MTDSYNAIKASVQDQISKVRIKREHYVDIIMTTDTYINEDHKAIRISITKDLRELDKELKVFIAGVEQVEKNRAKFVHIKDAELALRRKTANEMKAAVDEMKASINSADIRKKIDGDEQKAKRRAADTDNDGNSPTIENENDAFIGDQTKQIKAQIEEQDKILVQIDAGLDRLQETGRAINQELKIQDKMLDKLDDDLDEAGKKMGVVMKNLSKVLQTKDTFQIGAVIAMILILAALIALIIWT